MILNNWFWTLLMSKVYAMYNFFYNILVTSFNYTYIDVLATGYKNEDLSNFFTQCKIQQEPIVMLKTGSSMNQIMELLQPEPGRRISVTGE